jgi:hypothetical protein
MRTIISTLGLVVALGSCSQGVAPASPFGPGPSDPGGSVGDPQGPTQDNLTGTHGAGGAPAGTAASTGAGAPSSSSSGGGTVTFSCDITTGGTHVCLELDNLPAASQGTETTTCTTTDMGTPGTGCSATNRLGTCALPSTTSIVTKEAYYSDGTLDATQAQTACSSANGTWTPL